MCQQTYSAGSIPFPSFSVKQHSSYRPVLSCSASGMQKSRVDTCTAIKTSRPSKGLYKHNQNMAQFMMTLFRPPTSL
ncbi:unnamed protein product [Sympodiomycopsis kandeliae]